MEYKTISFYNKECNLSQRNNKTINKQKSLEILNENSKFSKKSALSNSYIKKKLLMINEKKNSSKKIKINITNNTKDYPKYKCINAEKKRIFKNIKTNRDYTKTLRKNSNKYIKINKSSYSNLNLLRNRLTNKNTPDNFKKYISFSLFPNNIRNIENSMKTINVNKNYCSLNSSNKKFKLKNNKMKNKKKLININSIIPVNKINKMNSTKEFNHSNNNINKIFININDFKRFNGELLKRKLKIIKNNKNNNTFHINSLESFFPSIQSLKINKKKSFFSIKKENNNFDFININIHNKTFNKNNKKEENINKRNIIHSILCKNKKMLRINNSKPLITSKNLGNNIIHSYSINHLNNYNNQANKLNLSLFQNLKKNKKLINCNKKRNINNNITDISFGNNTTKNKNHKKELHDIINIRIDNNINNKIFINTSLINFPIPKYLYSNTNCNIEKNKTLKNTKVQKSQDNIFEKDILKNKIKKYPTKYNINSNKILILYNEINKNSKNIKKKEIKNYLKKKNKEPKNKSNHKLIYLNLISRNKIKNVQKRKYQSKNKTNNNKNINKNISLNENIKKIREERKKISHNLSILSMTNLKKNSNIKLKGLKTIFSNFYNIDNKQFLLFNTPRGKSSSLFNSFNYLNISRRFNKTEEKIFFYYKNIPKNEEDDYNNNKIKNNPQYPIEYIDEILQNLLIEENKYFQNKIYSFNINNNFKYCINPESWKFFINSLIKIQEVIFFNEHTLFSTVQIFDKYIIELLREKINIIEENLDIVIVTSLIIASKREEIRLYPMKDYLNLLPDKYSIKDLIKNERDILYKLQFNLLIPNSFDFFELFSVICQLDNFQKCKGLYLLNIILLDCYLLKIPSSLIAFCVVKIISKNNIKKNILSRIVNEYKDENNLEEIKTLKIIKDNSIINNICEYIHYIEKNIKISIYDSAFNKFNTIKYYFVPSYGAL